MLKTISLIFVAIFVLCGGQSSPAQNQPPSTNQGVVFLTDTLANDANTFFNHGKSILQYQTEPSSFELRDRVHAWLSGSDSAAITSSVWAKRLLFSFFWIGTQLPINSPCFKNVASDDCWNDVSSEYKRIKGQDHAFMSEYATLSSSLGLPLPGVEMPHGQSEIATYSLPLPDKHDFVNAINACNELGLATGNKGMSKACIVENDNGLAALKTSRSDPHITISLWGACQQASNGTSATNYSEWARCVRFVGISCPANEVRRNDEFDRKCLRAIASEAWMSDVDESP